MAFNRKNSRNVAQFNTNSADGFINLDIVMSDGSTQRVGGIALHSNKRLHERLLERGNLDGITVSISMNVISESEELDFATDNVDELVEELKQANS